MGPMASGDHSWIVNWLAGVFQGYCLRHDLGRFYGAFNIREPGSGDRNFRVPDAGLLSVDDGRRWSSGKKWLDEGCRVVVEVRSPDDETYDKFSFYAARGVGEVVVIDEVSLRIEGFRLAGRQLLAVGPDRDGWVACEGLRARFIVRKDAQGRDRLVAHFDLDDRDEMLP